MPSDEKKLWRKAGSPCIGVCKFRDEGHCVGCRMTKREKKGFKTLEGAKRRRRFFLELADRLESVGRFGYWSRMYRRRCERKGRACPIDLIEAERAPDAPKKAA